MDYNKYRNKIYNVITKSVYEDGVYSIVEELIEMVQDTSKVAIINVQRAREDAKEKRFQSKAGAPDLLLVTKDFEYNYSGKEKGEVLASIEVKAPSVALEDVDSRAKYNIEKYGKYIYTNGLVWRIYNEGDDDNKCLEICLCYNGNYEVRKFSVESGQVFNKDWILKEKFGELLFELSKL